jgi:predicted transcriptional regulator
MVKMRGSKTRLEILKILDTPKTRQMIAQELNIDWKAVDRHVEVMLKSDLIKEVCNVARASYYARSEKGDKLLELLNNEYSSNNNDLGMLSIALFVRRKIAIFAHRRVFN